MFLSRILQLVCNGFFFSFHSIFNFLLNIVSCACNFSKEMWRHIVHQLFLLVIPWYLPLGTRLWSIDTLYGHALLHNLVIRVLMGLLLRSHFRVCMMCSLVFPDLLLEIPDLVQKGIPKEHHKLIPWL